MAEVVCGFALTAVSSDSAHGRHRQGGFPSTMTSNFFSDLQSPAKAWLPNEEGDILYSEENTTKLT